MQLKTDLYPWQANAVEKLIGIRVGALYMEMGTGKTRTALEMIQRRLDAGKLDHVLWLCPCSVRQNLKEDINKHADNAFSRIAIYGIESLSSSLRLYELLLRYVQSGRTMLIVDESNLVKNHKAIRTRRITNLAHLCKYRIILNGTPISRNESDLFAQWYLLDWRILGYKSFWSFAANHIEFDPVNPKRIRRTLNTDYLIEKISPYSYQVSRSECLSLPGKVYRQDECWMTADQDSHYDAVMSRMIESLDDQKPETVYRMFSAAQAIISGLYVADDGKHLRTRPMFADPMENPRIRKLLDVVNALEGQALIFCKYTHEINDICRVLPDAVPFFGRLSMPQRMKNLEKFKAGKRFLVANKTCAGYGLNLQFCHNVIYYSNDWDWATRIQSEDRVYRLGQDHEVRIFDICAKRSLDEKILRCLSRKEGLEESIKRALNTSNGQKSARDKFRQWLRGELDDRKDVSGQERV